MQDPLHLEVSMRKVLLMVATFTCLSIGSPAAAITDGEPDRDGHPMVAAIIAEFDGVKDWYCSGTLISPTVVLTAGHCVSFLEEGQDVWVTFDAVFSKRAKLYHGEYVLHPEYSGNNLSNDVAVILLDRAVKNIEPATIAELGLLDEMKADGSLAGTTITNVGFGCTRTHTGAPPSFDCDGVRRVSTSPVSGLTQTHLVLNMNTNATGGGGTCGGDSGGPHFLEGTTTIVSITSWGDANCISLDQTQRVDIASVQEFLDDYVTL
jgi:secreted trypsin-like serine protease